MIYGEDVTHIITEEGIGNLLLCETQADRERAHRCPYMPGPFGGLMPGCDPPCQKKIV
jgi:hypothetical protein